MYPIMLNLTNKRVLVVGGGKIATKKVLNLIPEKAEIIVVSPTITAALKDCAQKGEIKWYERIFNSKDTDDCFLVIAATNNSIVNLEVKKSCHKHQLVNIVDNQEESDFYNMATLERGKLKIAISTEGASPLLSKQIKKDLLHYFDESYEDYLQFLFDTRKIIQQTIQDEQQKKELLKQLLHDKFRESNDERESFLKQFSE